MVILQIRLCLFEEVILQVCKLKRMYGIIPQAPDYKYNKSTSNADEEKYCKLISVRVSLFNTVFTNVF